MQMTLKSNAIEQNKKAIFIFSFFVTILIVSFPLFAGRLTSGHDLYFHFLRLAGISDGLLNGDFPVRIYYSFYNGYGYAPSLFYPDFFLYPFAAISAMGVGEILSYNLLLLTANIATFLVAAYSFRRLFRSDLATILGAILYTVAPYHIHLIYVRQALGEIIAYIFIPLLAYAIYNLLRENFSKPYILCIAFTGLVLSHLLSTILCAVICAVAILIGIRRLRKNPVVFAKLAGCALVCLVLTAGFWLPLIEQLMHGDFLLGSAENYLPKYHTASLHTMFFGKNETAFGLTFFPILLLRIFYLKEKKEKALLRVIDLSGLAGILLLLASSSLFPWHWMPDFVSIIQFPWRLYTYAIFCFVLASCGLCILLIRKMTFQKPTHLVFFFLVAFQLFFTVILMFSTVLFSPLSSTWNSGQRDIYSNNGYEYLDSDMHYQWIETLSEDLSSRMSGGTILQSARSGNVITVELRKSAESICVPFLYYYGYSAEYTSPDGQIVSLPVDRAELMQITIVDTSSVEPGGTVTVQYKDTPLQTVSFLISLSSATTLLIAGGCIYLKKRRRRSSKTVDNTGLLL
jgi:hypothetical protein